MIGEREVKEILTQYEKHGWSLRRVLLCADAKNRLPAALFGQVEVVASEINALWFSRPAFEERETWELRHLSAAPFALVEVFEADDEEDVREDARCEMQTRLAELASKFGNKKVTG